ncbi:S1 family peptidase [Streptomyces boluensis]|uniref:Trypsin-like serine protease n=1 Tax=Streptomyces boluensis TaxID=1775135 RepID=A0A964V0L2_9ACTN|nr:serine protease [Streptomyces boluensis]NBE54930.1 trypsin-like serine protease [Streptomyces boluensis]
MPNRIPSRIRAVFAASVLLSCAVVSDASAQADAVPGPNHRVGALFSHDLRGGHFCTASVVHSQGRDLIVTAGHCLAEGADVAFAPGYHEGEAPYGMWQVDRVFADAAWTGSADEEHDLAFATVRARDGRRIEDVTGAVTLDPRGRTGHPVTLTGYPSAEDAARTCTATPALFRGSQQRVACPDFSTGTSGSPWVTADGRLTGVLGGYQEGGDTADVSYSVLLDERAAALYRTATGGTTG